MRFLASMLLTILMIGLAATYLLIPARDEEIENQWIPVEDSCNQLDGHVITRPDSHQMELHSTTITSLKPSDASI